MAPLICLVAAFIAFRLLGFAVPYLADWQHALRAALGVMFVLTASAHWGKRRPDLIRMVPGNIGSAGFWVSITGIAEIIIAVLLQVPGLAKLVALASVAMLCCLFVANAKAAREHLTIFQKPAMSFAPRLLLQLVFIAALISSVWPIS